MFYRRVPFSHTLNARDLGGYATPLGITKWNVFFRSGCLVNFDDNDEKLLGELGIKAIIDLRGGGNVDESLPTPQNLKGVARYNIPLGDGSIPYFAKDVANSYMDFVANTQSVKNIFDVFAKENGAVLFHCFAGKDRTGVVAALLLLLVGVSDTDIIADYTLTYAYFLDRIQSDFSRTDAERNVFVPQPDHMKEFLRLFRNKYGSVQNYLSGVGVDATAQQKIIDKFTENLS